MSNRFAESIRVVLETAEQGSFRVALIDAEGLIGLKIQGAATNPDRALRDRDDIRQLVARHGSTLDLELVRDYYRLFGLEDELDDLLKDLGVKPR